MPDSQNHSESWDMDRSMTDDDLIESTDPASTVDDQPRKPPIVAEMNPQDAHALDRMVRVERELSARQPKLVRAALDGTLTGAQLREVAGLLDRLAVRLHVRAGELDGTLGEQP